MNPTVIVNGKTVQFSDALDQMDETIRDELNSCPMNVTRQEFVNMYCDAHAEAFGEVFNVNFN